MNNLKLKKSQKFFHYNFKAAGTGFFSARKTASAGFYIEFFRVMQHDFGAGFAHSFNERA
jgi:hypothetical protein